MLSNNEVDAVVIVTPAELHYRLAKEALMTGKDLFCEKPLALQIEEARELVGLAEKKRRMAVFDNVAKEDKLLLYPHRIDWVDRIPIPQKENAQRVDFKMLEPLKLKEKCSHFLSCLRTRQQSRTDGKKGIAVLEVLSAAQISLEKGGEPCDIGPKDYYAHPTATIDEGCEVGSDTKIWHYCHILKGAKIGKDCNLGQDVVIFDGASLGNNVKVQNNVSIYAGVTLEDDVFCGPSMVFTNVTTPRSHVLRKGEYRRTLVRKGATIGANATIVWGITINEYAFIGAGAVVTKDVPANALVIVCVLQMARRRL